MLTRADMTGLFQAMRTAYGNQWKHGPEALEVWGASLKGFERSAISGALKKTMQLHMDYPPTLPQFVQLVRESMPALPGPEKTERSTIEKTLAYGKPQSKSNPAGNPYGITLPDFVMERRVDEGGAAFERRIATAVTRAKYPNLSTADERGAA